MTRFAVAPDSFLPNGLMMNESTGVISGIPTQEGLTAVTLRIYNQNYYKEILQNIIVIRPQCSAEKLPSGNYMETDQGTTFITDCPLRYIGSITRYCPLDRIPIWDEPNTGNCSKL